MKGGEKLKITDRFKNFFTGKVRKISRVDVIKDNNVFSTWGFSPYENDIVRSCINAKAKRIAKLTINHIRSSTDDNGNKVLQINPEPYMRFLLEEPNRYMCITDFLKKCSAIMDLTQNLHILILRDENGMPSELFPISCLSATADTDKQGNLYYTFNFPRGKRLSVSDSDIIHIRGDFAFDDIFGTSRAKSLSPLMEVVETTDRGIINAIKNSSVIRWLLKYTTSMRDEDLKTNAQQFADNYLNISSDSVGVAAVDAKADATQINAQDYVPNATQMEKTRTRILSLFGMSEKILQSTANEDEENAYYEAEIEPFIKALQEEMTRKLFTRRQRGSGNKISVGSFNLQGASLSSKLQFMNLVDRGALTVNEWRETLGLGPVPGGDNPIRRLDTATVVDPEPAPSGDDEGGDE